MRTDYATFLCYASPGTDILLFLSRPPDSLLLLLSRAQVDAQLERVSATHLTRFHFSTGNAVFNFAPRGDPRESLNPRGYHGRVRYFLVCDCAAPIRCVATHYCIGPSQGLELGPWNQKNTVFWAAWRKWRAYGYVTLMLDAERSTDGAHRSDTGAEHTYQNLEKHHGAHEHTLKQKVGCAPGPRQGGR